MNFRKFRKNAKALSPVVASIILIAVTVAVSVVVAAWMGGMSLGLMGSSEQLTVTNVQFVDGADPTPDEVIVSIRNNGDDALISKVYVNGDPGTYAADPTTIDKGTITDITVNLDWAASQSYSIKFTTAKGNNVEYAAVSPAVDTT